MRKPRLLVVTSTYPRWKGDTEPAFVHQLASRLTGRFDVTVATSRAPGAMRRETMDGVQIHRYAYAPARWETLVYGGGLTGNLRARPWKLLLLPTYLLRWAKQVSALVRERRVDVIHAHWFVPGGLVAACMARGTPLCVTAHGTDVLGLRGGAWNWVRRHVAAKAHAVTVVGGRVGKALDADGITHAGVMPMGVDLSDLFVPDTQRIRGSNLLFVGRLVGAKRVDTVLHAFRDVLEVHGGCRLDIVGNGPERGRLESLAATLEVADKVSFHGSKSQAELADLYRSACGLLVASGSEDAPEGLGLVAVEALGCGCPVVSVPNPALQALLPVAAPIRYARDGGAVAMAEAVIALLEESADNPDNVDGQWRQGLVDRFDWAAVAARYGDLLESLLEAEQ